MKRTSADDVIIHALCPGPADTRVLGAPLVTYASRSATRAARSAVVGAGAVSGCAHALTARASVVAKATALAAIRFVYLMRRPFVGRPFRVDLIGFSKASSYVRRTRRVHDFECK